MRYVVVWLSPDHPDRGEVVDLHDDADRARWSRIEVQIAHDLCNKGTAYTMWHSWEEWACQVCEGKTGGQLLCDRCAAIIDLETETLLEERHDPDWFSPDWYE